MSEDETEVPEAKDPFERQVALTVAILAVILSLVSSSMDNARLKALLAESQATDQWAFYQAKSLKGGLYEVANKSMAALSATAVNDDQRKVITADFAKNITKYEGERTEIQAKAQELEEHVAYQNERIELFEHGEVLLHIAIVLGSITILIRMKQLWWACVGLGTLGSLMGLWATFSHPAVPASEGGRPEGAIVRPVSMAMTGPPGLSTYPTGR